MTADTKRPQYCESHGRLRCTECAYLNEVIQERDALAALNEQTQKALTSSEGDVRKLAAELAEAKARANGAEENERRKCADLKETIAELEAERDAFKYAHEMRERDVDGYQKQVAELTKDMHDILGIQSRLAEKSTDNIKAYAEIGVLHGKLAAAEAEIKRLEFHGAAYWKAEYEKLRKELSSK